MTHFGTTADGQDVDRITLQAGDLTVAVLTWGAVVQDVRLVNWPERLLLQALPKGLILEQGQRQRDVFRRDQRIASVIYTPNQQQWHEAQLTNYQHNYRLTVKAL